MAHLSNALFALLIVVIGARYEDSKYCTYSHFGQSVKETILCYRTLAILTLMSRAELRSSVPYTARTVPSQASHFHGYRSGSALRHACVTVALPADLRHNEKSHLHSFLPLRNCVNRFTF